MIIKIMLSILCLIINDILFILPRPFITFLTIVFKYNAIIDFEYKHNNTFNQLCKYVIIKNLKAQVP